MTRIIIKSVPQRAEYAAYLRRLLPAAEWCQCDGLEVGGVKPAMRTFLRALHMAGDSAAVHLEDDVVLTRDFVGKLEVVVKQRFWSVIQFFSMRKLDVTVGSRWDSDYMMNQCFYLPPGYSLALMDFHARWPGKVENPTGTDTMLHDFLKARKERYWLHVPSLVQHRECKSVIDARRSSKRQSITFVDPQA
ncbi:MAG: hypothetical protein KGL39_03130 [Patescibacteria group bacterium]|nr:hypothetical protein [Patescibacteria group bacterium]